MCWKRNWLVNQNQRRCEVEDRRPPHQQPYDRKFHVPFRIRLPSKYFVNNCLKTVIEYVKHYHLKTNPQSNNGQAIAIAQPIGDTQTIRSDCVACFGATCQGVNHSAIANAQQTKHDAQKDGSFDSKVRTFKNMKISVFAYIGCLLQNHICSSMNVNISVLLLHFFLYDIRVFIPIYDHTSQLFNYFRKPNTIHYSTILIYEVMPHIYNQQPTYTYGRPLSIVSRTRCTSLCVLLELYLNTNILLE